MIPCSREICYQIGQRSDIRGSGAVLPGEYRAVGDDIRFGRRREIGIHFSRVWCRIGAQKWQLGRFIEPFELASYKRR